MTFARNLQSLRGKAGLSQSQLAAQAGIPVRTIQNWEISRRTPRWIVLLARLARGLGVSMEELTTGLADEEEEPARAPRKPRARPHKGKGK